MPPLSETSGHRIVRYLVVSLLRRQQKSPGWPGVDVAIGCHFLVAADFGTLQAEGDDLAFFVDGESAGQHHVFGKVGDRFVQVDEALLGCPEKGPRAQSGCHFAHDLARIVNVKGFTVDAVGKRPELVHSGGAGPDKSTNSPAALGSANHHSAVIDMVGAAAGIAGKEPQVLHSAVSPQKCVRTGAGIRQADDLAKIIDAVRFTGGAAERAQILNVTVRPESGMSAGAAGNLALIVDGKRRACVGARQSSKIAQTLGGSPGKGVRAVGSV